ncbi:MAG: restriction endonuclease subunit S [Candidatus Kapaibacterium sp.]
MELKNILWDVFTFEDIFNIYSTSSSIDKNKLINKSGTIPYITRSEKNNGIDFFVGTQDKKYSLDNKNVITIGLDTQTVFFQPHSFYTGQNIQILSNDNINHFTAQFLIPLIKIQMEKFNWGGNGATLARLKRSKILLPVNSNGSPDYVFMENFIRLREIEKYERYKSILTERIETLKNFRDYVPLNQKEWGEFFIEEIFNIKPGKRLTKANMKKGLIPFIGASDSNNGITNYVANNNTSLDANVLGVNYNGSVVENFYHPYKALFSDDVKRLSLKQVQGNEFIYLFIKTVILKQKSKFQYAYKFNETRMVRQKILLPVDKAGLPDYDYMENYVKKLEFEKLTKYLSIN